MSSFRSTIIFQGACQKSATVAQHKAYIVSHQIYWLIDTTDHACPNDVPSRSSMAGTAPHGASGFQVSTFDNNCAPCTSHVRRPELAFGQRCKTIEREEQCFGLRVICQGDLKEIERERLCSYTSRHHIAHAVQTRTISQNSEAGRYRSIAGIEN